MLSAQNSHQLGCNLASMTFYFLTPGCIQNKAGVCVRPECPVLAARHHWCEEQSAQSPADTAPHRRLNPGRGRRTSGRWWLRQKRRPQCRQSWPTVTTLAVHLARLHVLSALMAAATRASKSSSPGRSTAACPSGRKGPLKQGRAQTPDSRLPHRAAAPSFPISVRSEQADDPQSCSVSVQPRAALLQRANNRSLPGGVGRMRTS